MSVSTFCVTEEKKRDSLAQDLLHAPDKFPIAYIKTRCEGEGDLPMCVRLLAVVLAILTVRIDYMT